MPNSDQDNVRVMRIYRSDLADELRRWAAAAQELAQARDCLLRINAELGRPEQDRDSVLMMACWDAAVLRATRVFEGKMPLPRSVLESLPEGAGQCLDYFINVRNKHVAHRVNPVDEIKAGVFVRDQPDTQGNLVDGAGTVSMVLIQWSDPAVVRPLHQFVFALGKACNERVRALNEKVRAEANTRSEAELRKMQPARLVAKRQKHLVPRGT